MPNMIPKERVNNQRIDPGREVIIKRQEKLKRRWNNNSLWNKLKQGPLASTLYAITLYPRVFFNRCTSNKSYHPSLTVYQETAIRTIRRSLSSSLLAIRSNSAFMESPLKALHCSEPIEPVMDVVGVKGYWLGAKVWKGRQVQAVLLYMHGGGYVSSSLSGVQSLCYLLKTLRTKHNKHIRALVIDYALAPENPYPGGLNSAANAYRWLTTSGIPGSQNVFLCGTSAGGALVLALLQSLYLDATVSALPRPLGAILISPWVEVSCGSPSYFSNSKSDILTAYFCQLAADNYIFGKEGNPANRNLRGDTNDQKSEKEIIAWLEDVESAFGPVNHGKNEEKTSSGWKHEVVNVKRHSGEGTTPKRNKRNSRASRSSRNSRVSRASRTSRNSKASQASRNSRASRTSRSSRCSQPQFTEPDGTIEMTEMTNKYHQRASAYAILTSKNTTVTRPQDSVNNSPFKKHNSIVRFSDSLEIYTQTDLDQMINIQRGSWIRKSLEPNQTLDIPQKSLKDVDTVNPFAPPTTTDVNNLHATREEKKQNLDDASDKNPFINPMISPLYTPQHLLAKFPPLFISYGGREIFKDDIEKFCQKCMLSKNASEAGRSKKNFEEGGKENDLSIDEVVRKMREGTVETHPDVVVELNKDMVHSYPMLLGVFGKHSKEALIKIAAFLNAHIPAPPLPPSILRTNSASPSMFSDSSNRMSAASSFTEFSLLEDTTLIGDSDIFINSGFSANKPKTSINTASSTHGSQTHTSVSSNASKRRKFEIIEGKSKPDANASTTKNIVPIIATKKFVNVRTVSPKSSIQSTEFPPSTLSEQTEIFPIISSSSLHHKSSRYKSNPGKQSIYNGVDPMVSRGHRRHRPPKKTHQRSSDPRGVSTRSAGRARSRKGNRRRVSKRSTIPNTENHMWPYGVGGAPNSRSIIALVSRPIATIEE